MTGPDYRGQIEVRIPGPGHETTQLVVERLRGWIWLSLGAAGASTVLVSTSKANELIRILTKAKGDSP